MLLRNKINIALLIGLILTLIISDFTSFTENYKNLQTDVLRMHILANSDSETDQNLKLLVRDELLRYSEEFFGDCNTMDELLIRAESVKDKITDIANSVLSANGADYTAACEVVKMEFDDRYYDLPEGGATMPAGNYEAVRITLGDAGGKNWWCVMYPALCLPYVTEKPADCSEFFTDEQIDIMKNPKKYKAKFKILELWEKYFNK